MDVNVPKAWEPYFKELLDDIKIQKELELNNFSKSRSGLGVWIIREFLMKHTSFRFEHINTYEDHVTIMDKRIRRVVDVFVKEKNRLWCENCDEIGCEHVHFALAIPEVRKILKKKGWDLSEADRN